MGRDWLFPAWGPAVWVLTSDKKWHSSPTQQRSQCILPKTWCVTREDALRSSLGQNWNQLSKKSKQFSFKGVLNLLTGEGLSVDIYTSKKVCSDTGGSPKMSEYIHKHFDFPFFLRKVFKCSAYLVKDTLWVECLAQWAFSKIKPQHDRDTHRVWNVVTAKS